MKVKYPFATFIGFKIAEVFKGMALALGVWIVFHFLGSPF